jgi:transcriptional regulator with XRE-family HTH domain
LFQEQNWTQRQVAKELDLDPSFLSKALRGASYKRLSPDVIAQISQLAGLPADHFPEVREHVVIEAVRADDELRDRLYDELNLSSSPG